MSVARRRCCIQFCKGWEFQNGVCRECCKKNPDFAEAMGKFIAAPPLQSGLFVAAPIASPHFLTLAEGEQVDVLDVLSDNESVVVRTQDGSVGYFRLDYLATESELYDRFNKEAAESAVAAVADEKRRQKEAEEAYERNMRNKMFEQARLDKEARSREAEERRAEAERRQLQLQEMRHIEEEQRAHAEAALQRARRAEAQRLQVEQSAREQEAHASRAEWDAQEERMRQAKILDAMPQWKRDLYLKKQAQNNRH